MATQINLYRSQGEWCYAAFVDGEFDTSDTVDCDDSASYDDVVRYMADNFTGWTRRIVYAKVEDI